MLDNAFHWQFEYHHRIGHTLFRTLMCTISFVKKIFECFTSKHVLYPRDIEMKVE